MIRMVIRKSSELQAPWVAKMINSRHLPTDGYIKAYCAPTHQDAMAWAITWLEMIRDHPHILGRAGT